MSALHATRRTVRERVHTVYATASRKTAPSAPFDYAAIFVGIVVILCLLGYVYAGTPAVPDAIDLPAGVRVGPHSPRPARADSRAIPDVLIRGSR